jgi:putative SOS response-associated peptidase YedK
MCNLYRLKSNAAELRAAFDVAGAVPNLPDYPEIYPDREAPIIQSDALGVRHIAVARWGVPPPGDVGRPVTNVRNLASPFWRGALATPARRCLVPVTAFVEWTAEVDAVTGRKRKIWFTMADGAPFAFAGLTRAAASGERQRFAFLTCAPNAMIGAVHPKAMPVILRGTDCDAWLAGDTAEALAVTYPSADMVILDG